MEIPDAQIFRHPRSVDHFFRPRKTRARWISFRAVAERNPSSLARAHEDFETLFGDRQFDPQAVHASLLSAMKFKEHQLLHKTYAFTLEWDDPYPQVTHRELVESLAKDYRAFGLTVGKHHSDELVRDFERAVRRAALATLGPTY